MPTARTPGFDAVVDTMFHISYLSASLAAVAQVYVYRHMQVIHYAALTERSQVVDLTSSFGTTIWPSRQCSLAILCNFRFDPLGLIWILAHFEGNMRRGKSTHIGGPNERSETVTPW